MVFRPHDLWHQRKKLPLTNDYFDDLSASVINYQGGKAVLFVNNQTVEHILPMKLDTITALAQWMYFVPSTCCKDKMTKTIPNLEDLPKHTKTVSYNLCG